MAKKQTKAIVCFVTETDSDLLTLAGSIIEGLTGNAYFQNPVPSIAVVTAVRDAYKESLVAAGSGKRTAIITKQESRLVLEDMLNKLGNYVNTIARGNDVALASTRFPLTKQPEPAYLGSFEKISLAPGANGGTLECKLTRVKNSKAYTFMITEDPQPDESLWRSYTTTMCSYTFTNLQPGKKYWVKVSVAGTRGQSIQSNAICQYAVL